MRGLAEVVARGRLRLKTAVSNPKIIAMLIIVLSLNLLIAGLCWYGVWQIWQLRQNLVRVTAALTLIEQDANRILFEAVNAIRQGHTGTAQMRQQYQQILLRLQQVQQAMALLGLGQLAWQRYRRPFPQDSSAKNSLVRHPSMQPSLLGNPTKTSNIIFWGLRL